MRAFPEREMEAVGRPPALVAPVFLEDPDKGFVQILRDLTDVVTHGAGHLFDYQRAVRFAAERQQDLTDTLGEGLFPRRHFAERFRGVFEVFSHDRCDTGTVSFIARLSFKANSWLMQPSVVTVA
jgi:hypothetical protein